MNTLKQEEITMSKLLKTIGTWLLLGVILFACYALLTAPYGWDARCIIAECRISK